MNSKGITLIELVIVMVIIAIGAALMTPSTGAWLSNYRLKSAARDLVSTMRIAQMKAVTYNKDYRVLFDTGERSYILQYRTTMGVNNWASDGVSQNLPKDVTFADVGFSGGLDYAVFNPNSTSSAGSIDLSNTKGMIKTITVVSSTGRVHLD